MSLETCKLGQSDLEITRIGLGTAPIGSIPDWRIYWGYQDERESIRTIEAALDLGINWIDTAPFYGWGTAEQIVGRALQGKRDKVYIFTKCGTLRDEQRGEKEDLSPASIRREVEISLRNLKTDYIDLYQFHDPDPDTPIEESWGAMQKLVEEGKVRYGGLSNHTVDLMQRALAVAPITSNQHHYNLLNREIEEDILPFSQQHGIGVLCWSPLASGFLADGFDLDTLEPQDFRKSRLYAQEPTFSRIKELRAVLQQIAEGHHKSMAQLSIAWVLMQPAVTGAINGIRNPGEAQAMPGCLDWKLTDQELQTIQKALPM